MVASYYTVPGAQPQPNTPRRPGNNATSTPTPIKHKLASEINKPLLLKKTVDPMLLDEIGASHLKDVPGLLPALFPDACLPLPSSEIFDALTQGSSPLYDGSKWVGCPNLSVPSVNGDVEGALVAFFETFAERVTEVCNAAGKSLPQTKRAWTAEFVNKGVEDAPNIRKPDFVCGEDTEYRWPNIQIHGELKSSDSSVNQKLVLAQLLNGAYLIFSNQDNRRFVISIAFMADDIRLFIFDRAGLVTTAPFNLHEDPKSFVRVFATLMFTNDRAVLGYDTSIIATDAGRFVEVGGVTYRLVKRLFISDVIRGRGTVCWHARHDGQDFVIKDTWTDASRPYTEAEILLKAKDIEGVPKVVAETIVKVNGVDGRTHNLRSNITPTTSGKLHEKCSNIEKRIHRRLVLTPFGHALSTFASRKELTSIFIDVVEAHRDLSQKANILHRDISMNNIMLVPSPQTWKSADLPPTSPSLAALAGSHPLDISSAGTLPFMAIDILADGEGLPAHEPKHDLESLLYVLIWVCVHYAGPGDVERQNFNIHNSPLRHWVKGDDYTAIGLVKDSAMRNTKFWKRNVLDSFAPYFEPLKPCASSWRQLFLEENLDYDPLLKMLHSTLSLLDDVEVWSEKDDPAGYGDGTTRKRRLARIGEEDEPEGAEENDNRPRKSIRSENGDPRAVQSEPPPRLTIKQAMKPKQKPRTKVNHAS
ncbi:hypothetical protein B0H13DRAFT_1721285 [Mycena leptocephala]|nr:hypothetical protein B0H13DRAFT_1721285 [Mycena leptocephala]